MIKLLTKVSRYMHSGTMGLPLSTCEPLQVDLLPCDDKQWAQGRIGAGEPLYATSPSVGTTSGVFASLCRAAHILGRVVRHRDDLNLDLSFQINEATTLHHALVALESTFPVPKLHPHDEESACDIGAAILPFLINQSARYILYTMYACNDFFIERCGEPRIGRETEIQKLSITGLENLTENMYELAGRLQVVLKISMNSVSPLASHCLFLALSECAWYVREDGDDKMRMVLNLMMEVMDVLKMRWKVCGMGCISQQSTKLSLTL